MSVRCIALLCLMFVVLSGPLIGQTSAPADSLVYLPKGLENSIDKKITSVDKKLSQKSSQYVNKIASQEANILKELSKIDSSAAAVFLRTSKAAYERINKKLLTAGSKADRLMDGEYLPYLDSLQGSLGFLKDAKNVVSKSKDIQQKLGNSLQGVQQLQNKFNEAQNIQALLKDQQDQLQQLLSNYSNLPQSISKQFGKYQQEAYYYSQQVKEYKELLNDPEKLVAKTLEVLRKLPAFKQFMSKNSFLAMLFPTPENFGTPQALADLQTRADVQALLPTQLPMATASENFSANQYLQEHLKDAQKEVSKLKDKLSDLGVNGSGNSEMAMPAFIPDEQRTKSFWKRIVYSSSFQSQRATNYFPSSTDIALTTGYKISDKAVIGIGASWKMGWGKSWKQIKITGEGIGLRTYADWKAPDLFKTNSRFMASLWLTAGAEMNYNRTIEELTVFKNYSNWNKSALAGLTQKYHMNSPFKKGRKVQGSVSVLFDFLHRHHIPHTPAIIWRAGMGL